MQLEYGFTAYGNIPRDSVGAPEWRAVGAALLRKTTRTFVNPTPTAGDDTETVSDNSAAYRSAGVTTVGSLASLEARWRGKRQEPRRVLLPQWRHDR